MFQVNLSLIYLLKYERNLVNSEVQHKISGNYYRPNLLRDTSWPFLSFQRCRILNQYDYISTSPMTSVWLFRFKWTAEMEELHVEQLFNMSWRCVHAQLFWSRCEPTQGHNTVGFHRYKLFSVGLVCTGAQTMHMLDVTIFPVLIIAKVDSNMT